MYFFLIQASLKLGNFKSAKKYQKQLKKYKPTTVESKVWLKNKKEIEKALAMTNQIPDQTPENSYSRCVRKCSHEIKRKRFL